MRSAADAARDAQDLFRGLRTRTDLTGVVRGEALARCLKQYVRLAKQSTRPPPPFYPEGLVAVTYRFQQVDMRNAHPAHYGVAGCASESKFVLAYESADLAFVHTHGPDCSDRIGFGTLRYVQWGVSDEVDETDDRRDPGHIAVEYADCLVRLRQAESDLQKGRVDPDFVSTCRRSHDESQQRLACHGARSDARVREAMARFFQLGILAVNLRLLREALGPWVRASHMQPESARPTAVRVLPGWWVLRERTLEPETRKRIKLYVLTLLPMNHMAKRLKTFVPEPHRPGADPRLQNVRLRDYIDIALSGE